MAAFQAFHNSRAKVTVYAELIIHQSSQFTEISSGEENRAMEVGSWCSRSQAAHCLGWDQLQSTFTLITRRRLCFPFSCFISTDVHCTSLCFSCWMWRKIYLLRKLNRTQLDPEIKKTFLCSDSFFKLSPSGQMKTENVRFISVGWFQWHFYWCFYKLSVFCCHVIYSCILMFFFLVFPLWRNKVEFEVEIL